METTYISVYLVGLILLLGVASWLVFRQVFRSRGLEKVIAELSPKLVRGKGTAQEHYELGSAFLEKQLFAEATKQFQKSIQADEEFAPGYNNLGYAYFRQEQYDLAIRQYKEALRFKPNYTVAWSNLGHAYERKLLLPQALEAYEKVLELEPKNDVALRRAQSLRKRVDSPSKADQAGGRA
ncbi:MAG: tetratricopeptide repeat protein [Gloeobacterales cyanobacterium]